MGSGCLFSVSFLLSFTAVAGLLAAGYRLETYSAGGAFSRTRDTGMVLETREGRASRLFTATLAATIATAPLTPSPSTESRRWPFSQPGRRARGWLARDSLRPGHGGDGPGLATGSRPLLRITSAGTKCVAVAAETFAEIPFASLRVGTPSLLEVATCISPFSPGLEPGHRRGESGLCGRV